MLMFMFLDRPRIVIQHWALERGQYRNYRDISAIAILSVSTRISAVHRIVSVTTDGVFFRLMVVSNVLAIYVQQNRQGTKR